MKKVKIIGIVVAVLVIVGIVVFASTHEYKDSHLRVEGIRVRVPQGSLFVSECDQDKSNLAYCEKTIKVKDRDVKFKFAFEDFRENGYPNKIVASVDNKEFYKEEGLKIEENGPLDYRIFLNFHVINDEFIAFTFTKGSGSRVTTLYIMDKNGDIVLQTEELDKDDMRIRDYEEFITYDDKKNSVSVKATRLSQNKYQGKELCDVSKSVVIDATYTFTLKNGKFVKTQTAKTTVGEYIKNNNITCNK